MMSTTDPNWGAEYQNPVQDSREVNNTSLLDLPRDDLEMSPAMSSPDLSTATAPANNLDYQLGQWGALQFPTALAQYHAGLALCKEAIPRLAQQEWKRLQQHLSMECAQYRLAKLPAEYNLFQDNPLMPYGPLPNNDNRQEQWSC